MSNDEWNQMQKLWEHKKRVFTFYSKSYSSVYSSEDADTSFDKINNAIL